VSNLFFYQKTQNDFRFNRQKNYSLLQTDSKKTTKELSLKLNLSVTAVYERIKKLEREGIIDKYVVLLNKSKVEKVCRSSPKTNPTPRNNQVRKVK
jgi:DNA-binding Lrp family transcriptional regulator